MNRLSRSSRTQGSASPDPARESCEISMDHAPMSAPRSGYIGSGQRLLETPYGSIEADHLRGFHRFTRTEVPYPSNTAVEIEANEIERALDRCGRPRLLIDLRAAAPRNDPGFEVAVAKLRRKLFKGNERTAILVRTAVGALQVKRHLREDGFPGEVFQSEEEAIAYLEASPDSHHRVTVLPPSTGIRSPLRHR